MDGVITLEPQALRKKTNSNIEWYFMDFLVEETEDKQHLSDCVPQVSNSKESSVASHTTEYLGEQKPL
jgi:hypothetical protein